MVCYSPESIDIYIAGQSLSSATKPTGVPIRGRQRLMTSLHQTHFGTNQETAVIDDITAPNKMWHQSRDDREWWRHSTKQTISYCTNRRVTDDVEAPNKSGRESGNGKNWWRHSTAQNKSRYIAVIYDTMMHIAQQLQWYRTSVTFAIHDTP